MIPNSLEDVIKMLFASQSQNTLTQNMFLAKMAQNEDDKTHVKDQKQVSMSKNQSLYPNGQNSKNMKFSEKIFQTGTLNIHPSVITTNLAKW